MSQNSLAPRVRFYQGDDARDVGLYTDEGFALLADLWLKVTCERRLMYEPTWLGIPIIQYPDDIVMMQELIWNVRPDLIIETGVAHGGSAVFYASMLELLGSGRVLGIDVEIRTHNRVAIEGHRLSPRIELLERSSLDPAAVERARAASRQAKTTMVVLDSKHSYDHVRQELALYGPLVTPGSYLVAMDGAQGQVWDIPSGKAEWREDNPLRAIDAFISENRAEWEVDDHYTRLVVTSNPRGYLRRKNIDAR
jgi:cephalosporin hydroxylase